MSDAITAKVIMCSLSELAAYPRHLGANDAGILAALHTWDQNLMHDPHLHCIVSGGGLSADGQHWVASKSYYFLPVRVLSRVLRGKYCELLRQAYDGGELEVHGHFESRRASSSTWPATPIAWQSPIVDLSDTTLAMSPSDTRIMPIAAECA